MKENKLDLREYPQVTVSGFSGEIASPSMDLYQFTLKRINLALPPEINPFCVSLFNH